MTTQGGTTDNQDETPQDPDEANGNPPGNGPPGPLSPKFPAPQPPGTPA